MSAARVIEIADSAAESEKPAPGAIGLLDRAESVHVVRLVHEVGYQHVVQKQSLAHEAEVRAAETMVKHPSLFMNDPLGVIFGLDSDRGSRLSFSMKFKASEKKSALLASFGDFVAKLPGSRSIWDQALLTADEIYTNASKNCWPDERKLFNGPPVQDGEIEFMAEADGERLIIVCRDSFGAIDTSHVMGRIWTCFVQGVSNSIRHGAGGAGIGSYMIFEGCCSYYVGVDSGNRSVVGVALPLGLSRRTASELPKNLHLLKVPKK